MAQVAGKIQGLIDGDLGYLGSASLTERQLMDLLDLGMNDVVKAFDKDSNAMTMGRKRRLNRSNQEAWCPVDDRLQLQLEVVTRLLSCAQRLYISRESWDALDNPEETLEALLKVPSPNEDDEWITPNLPEAQELPTGVLANSPWMHLVLRKLIGRKYGDIEQEKGAVDDRKDESSSPSIRNPLNVVLEIVAKNAEAFKSPIPYLAIVGACTEIFPAGECWASSATENWHSFIPEDKLRGELIWCHGSSAFDLVSLLSILSTLLEDNGLPDSDSRTQYWILLTLTKLTEITTILVQRLSESQNNRNEVKSLTMIWRRIWKTLLRSDLRYTSFNNLGENTLGEIFVILLTEIISRRCTDLLDRTTNGSEDRQSSFIFEQQKCIWTLLLRKPVVFTRVGSRAQFELILSVSKFVGISDSKHVEESETPLRQELLRLSLSSFKAVVVGRNVSDLNRSGRRQLIQAVASCIVCLVNGSAPSMPYSLSTTSRFALTQWGDHALLNKEKKAFDAFQLENHSGLYLKLLWDSREKRDEDPDLSCFKLHTHNFDPPYLVSKRIRESSSCKERGLQNETSDFISEGDSEKLRRRAFCFISEEIPYISTEEESSLDSSDGLVARKEAQSVAVKLVLSLLISPKNLKTDLLARVPDIVSFFTKSVSYLAESNLQPLEYLEIANNLVKISKTLVEIVTRNPSSVDLSQRMANSISQSRSMLKEYSCQSTSNKEDLTSRKPIQTMEEDFSREDSDFDPMDVSTISPESSLDKRLIEKSGHTKRREPESRGFYSKRGKRRKINAMAMAPPNFQCAKAIGSLLITMEPSFSNCRLICEALLGTDIDIEPESIQGDMDLNSVTGAVSFLGMNEVLMNKLANLKAADTLDEEELSPIVMLCQIIDLVRECAGPFSPLFSYGNYFCSSVGVETLKLGLTLPNEEAKLLVGILTADGGMNSRVSLRAQKVEAATYIFENGNDDLLHLFDKFFTSSIVKAGFDDSNFLLRRLASIAAGSASSKFDEQRILNSVSNRIAPIFSSANAQKTIDMFTEWYVKSGLSSTDEDDISVIEAKDSLEVMESDAMFTKVVLAGSMDDKNLFVKLVQEILETPVIRPGLEFMCYRALEKVSFMRGYSDVQELLDLESESVLAGWLQKANDANNNDARSWVFPPSFTSPNVVWFIMLFGRYDYLVQSQFSADPNDESVTFRKQAEVNFLSRYRGFIIPFALLQSHNIIANCNSSNSIIRFLSNDTGFKLVQKIIGSSEEEESAGIVKILKGQSIAIETMCVLLIYSDDNLSRTAGQCILDNFRRVLSVKTIELQRNKVGPRLIQRVIQLAGRSRSLCETITFSESAYYEAIKYLASSSSQSRNISDDILIEAGTSLTEVTIYAYDKLMKSKLLDHQLNAWSRFLLLGEFLIDQLKYGGEQIQLDFFMHILVEIVSETSLSKRVRAHALTHIQKVMRECLRLNETELDRQLSPVINELVGVCFHIHEECQRNLLIDHLQKLKKQTFDLRRSRGFQQHGEDSSELQLDGSLSPLDLKRSMNSSPSAQLNHDCLVGTYDILLWIVQNKEALPFDFDLFENLSKPMEVDSSHLDVLARADKRYSAQNLGQGFGKNKKVKTLQHYVSGLKHRTQTSHFIYRQNNPVGRNANKYPWKHTTTGERLLCAELSQIEKLLEEAKMGEASSHDIHPLLSYICFISQTSYSPKVRLALSRCIALLEPRDLVNISGTCTSYVASLKSNYDSLQLELRAACIDCLAGLLKSTRTEVAKVAVMTLEAILSNNIGRASCSAIVPSTASLIKPFVSKENRTRVNATVLSSGERRTLVRCFGIRDGTHIDDESSWCWDKSFWTFANGIALEFEVWIKRLTSAIIICCFDPKKRKSLKGNLADDVEGSFFWHCQRIAYLDHAFASTIFPLLILTILQHEEHNSGDDQKFDGLNESISSCFESVLQSWILSQKSIVNSRKKNLKFQSLSILIDTLDVLRKMSQGIFLSSKHKPNKTTRTTKKGGHNAGLEPLVPWQGVPYGILLKIDGLVVAEACMEVERFASALFFLEIYFNAQYGKSGGLFEELDNTISCPDVIENFNGVRDISGNNRNSDTEASHDDDLKVRTMKAMSMAGKCYKELGEIELMHSANMHLSFLNFTDNSNSMAVDLDKIKVTSALDTLQVMSSHSSQISDHDNRFFTTLTDSMEALGLEGLITTYIEGVYVQNKGLKEMVDVPMLREKWFENSLGTQNWTLLPGCNIPKCGVRASNIVTPSGKVSDRGYFELLSESLEALSNSDTMSAKLSMNQANSRIIDSLSDLTGERLSPERFVDSVDKLRALKDVGGLIKDELDASIFDFNQTWMLKTSSRVREIALTCFASKYPEKIEHFNSLQEHLWKTCDCAVNGGRPEVAETALSKLKYLWNLNVSSYSSSEDKLNAILRIRLEEAKLMECRGDFNGAIQRTKQLISHIGDGDSTMIQESLLCDAQILCGSWMTKYKTQQAREILENYLNPAAARARRIFEKDKTTTNTERATLVFTKLGHKLSNLHDELLSRIHSKEWEETERRLEYQKKQCLDSVKHRRELKQQFEKLKRNSPRKDEFYKHWKETEGHFIKLEKEYKRTNNEREGIKRLVPHYLKHALKSFLSALEMAGTSSGDLSSHVFRMISLWFSYQHDPADDSTANDVMQEGLGRVPSFRFVTLTNQLFSRIDTAEGINDEKFQAALQSLVFRMCNGHPYHCIAPLIALMNGKVASKKLGVQQIVHEISKSGTGYVKDLLHSYGILIAAYNDLAYASTKQFEGSSQQKRKKIKFSELFPSAAKKSLDRCFGRLRGTPCVITCPPNIRPGKDYGCGKEDPVGGETIAGFEPDFAITESGIHRPKIVICTGSKGGSFRQLVKGEDDIRQDAIMSQVFTYVNNLMKSRTNSHEQSRTLKSSRRHTGHRLKMITYNVTPLSPSSGVSEIIAWFPIFCCCGPHTEAAIFQGVGMG